MKRTRTMTGYFLSAMLLVLTGLTAQAQTTNALDRVDFGNTASEAAHSFNPAAGTLPLAATGAFGQTYRQPYGAATTLTSQSELVFTLKCSATLQNYLTVKCWGNDTEAENLYLQNANDPLDVVGGPREFPNRFCYKTIFIPLSMTQGKTTVQLTLYPSGADTTKPARPIYSAFSHTDPRFVPSGSDPTGVKQAQDGFITPVALTAGQIIGLLQTNRQNIYGAGGYYSQILARQVLPGTNGAPTETIGLDLWNTVSGFSGNPDQWRDQIGGGEHGPGYSTLPDEMLSVLWGTYALPPFKDASGSTVAGLDHYHDATILTRIVSCLDGSTYLQSSDGSFNPHGDGASGTWQGLTSTPRAAGHPYAGSTARGTGWSLSLEGVDTYTLGATILNLLNDPTAGPAFQTSLGQSFDADLNGGSMLRASAYERMLSGSAKYLYNIAGGTDSQNLFEELGMYTAQLALAKLQALYPNSSYPGVGGAAAATRMQMVLGLVPESGMGGTDPGSTGFVNYGLTAGGFGEAHGSLSCGYDGRYGTIQPWLAVRLAQFAAQDSNVSSATLAQVQAAARATVDGFDQFISPEENVGFGNGAFYNHFTLAQEDWITYRDIYNPNADGNNFMVLGEYLDSDPSEPFQDGYALRSAYLEALYGYVTGTGDGGSSCQNYLKDTSAYESTLRSLIGVDPSTLKALPGEPGQPNHALVDAQCGTASVYYNGERFYLNANWQSFDKASGFGTVSNLARIHDTTGTVDRAVEIIMPHDATTVQSDGNLSGSQNQGWVVRYGPYLLAGNNSASGKTITLPSGTGNALELVSGTSYALGSSVPLAPGVGVAFVLPNLGAGSSGNGTAPLLADGVYTLTNRASSLLMDNQGNSSMGGKAVDQASGTNGLGQKWVLTNLGGNSIRLTNGYSADVLEVLNASTSQGATLDHNALTGAASQVWQLTSLSGGYYTLTNQNSGLALEVPGSSTASGTVLDQEAVSSGTNQQWTLTPTGLIPNGTYTLTNANSGLVWQAQNGNAVVQALSTGAAGQQWKVINYGSSLVTLSDLADSKAASVLYGYTGIGGQIYANGGIGGTNGYWTLAPGGAGQITLTGLASNLLLEVPGSATTAGTGLDIGVPPAAPNQLWNFATAAAYGQILTVQQNQATAVTLTGKDLNTPAQTLTFAVTQQPQHGTLSGTAPNLTYTPASGFSGADSFTFTASDTATAAPGTVAITVLPAGVILAADGSFETPAVGAASYQYDPTGSPWTFTGNSGIQSNGSVWNAASAPDGTQTAFLQGNGSNGAVSQSLAFNAAGTYVVSFQAAQRSGQVQPIQVSVNGTAVGSPITPAGTAFASYNSAPFTISAAGNATVTLAATAGGDNTSFVDLVVIRSAPTVATAASATPSPVPGKTTSVSVLGADAGGESGLTYTWSATGPAAVTFSPNGTNAAKSATATFSQAGSYVLTATLANAAGATTTSRVSVTVSQTLTAITVAPATVALDPSGMQAFTASANDQFGTALTTQPGSFTWAATGDGTITSGGLFTAGTAVGTASVTAATGSVTSASAGVTVLLTGSFETPAVGAGSYQYDPTGSPWTFSGNAGIQSNGSAWSAPSAPDGTQTAFLQGNGSNGTISHSVSFSATGTYHVSFQAAQRSGQLQPVQVSVDGVAVGSPISPTGRAFASYSSASFTISAAGFHTITLSATDSTGDKTTFLDKVTVVSPPLSVASAASATPSPVTGKTTAVSVLGADAGGEAGLTYTWSATGPASVTFSPNGTNAAKSATATFSQAGSYVLTATLANAAGATTTSRVSVTVSQTLTSIGVSPLTANLPPGETQQFTALANDQFGNVLTTQPSSFTWAATGYGNISTTGLFTAGIGAGTASITAASGGVISPTVTAFTPVAQINAGGPAVAPFVADTDFSGGSSNSTGATIDTSALGSAPAAVYQTGRYGTFSYTIPNLTPSAGYTLRLHFAETYWNTAGKRIENITVNGTTALSNFDIFAVAGAENKAVVETLAATADSTGKLTVSFGHASGSPDGNALVAGLEVLGSTASLPPTVATAASATPNPVTSMRTNISVLGADGAGESVLTYTWSATGPASVMFSANGTNAAHNATATFTQPGTYTVTATITDPHGGTATSSATVVVYRPSLVPMVMPLGDSITKGALDSGSGYRDEIYLNSSNAKIPLQFVGSASINASTQLINAGEQLHNGYGSYRIDDLRANLDGIRQPGNADDNQGGYWLTGGNTTGPMLNRAAVYPQVVLLMAGTNDVEQGASATTMESRLTDLLTWFQTNRPTAQVYVAQITPLYNTSLQPIIQQYNQWIGATVPGQFGANFHVVNMYSLFVDTNGNPKQSSSPDGIYLQDGIHPSHNGYMAMGDLWFSAIQSQITPAPTVTTTGLASSLNPAGIGQNITLTATVTGISPTGSVTFSDGTTVLATQTLTNGVATFTTSTLAVGTHSLSASYSGDTSNAANQSASLTQSVTPDVTSQVTVVPLGFRYNRAKNLLQQLVTLTNTGPTLTGPVSLVLDNLPVAVAIYQPSGTTQTYMPLNSSYVNAPLTDNTLATGASVTVPLSFYDPYHQAVTYSTRILAGDGSR